MTANMRKLAGTFPNAEKALSLSAMAGDLFDGDPDMSGLRGRLRRALPLLIGLSLIVAFLALLYSASQASSDRDRALSEQRHSFEVISLARRLDASIARAEVTLARYVISMEPDTGRLFQSQWRNAGAQLDALDYSTRGSTWQANNIPQLRTAYRSRSETLSEIGRRTTYDQKIGALSDFYAAGKAENLKAINAALAQVIAAENARLAERSTAVNLAGDRSQFANQTWRLVGLVLLLGGLCAAWAAIAAVNERRSDQRLAEAEMVRADRLEAAVTARTAELRQEAATRAQAEESLRQMQKMEAVGQLTGGIAHDFNNMLAVVIGGLELARRRLHEDPSDAERHIDNAMEGAGRATALTRRLLAFARAEPLLPAAVDPNALITGMIDLIDRTLGDQIIVRLQENARGWAVFVDQHQMENAILNLAVNARDAMDGRGTLTISTGQATLAANEVGESIAGDYVTIIVSDTGCGMTKDVLDRVFEPFFTTKQVGQGTGLGLSQIFGLVRQCKGEIRIVSEPEKGTQVELFLPRHAAGENAAPTPRITAPAPVVAETQTSAHILVVEDDPRVLAQTLAAIAELGHMAIPCPDPAQAATVLAGNDDIGLIISDVLMPGMTGPEMVRQLPRTYADIPVLFVTGYAGDVSDSAQFEGHPVLRKPYTLMGLSTAIVGALNGSRRSAAAVAAE